jgi:MFS family permease
MTATCDDGTDSTSKLSQESFQLNRRNALGRNFHLLWGASSLSFCGDGILLTGGPLMAAALTRNPSLVSGLTIAATLPWPLFCLVGGAFADRFDRIGIMWRMDLVRAALLAVLVIVFLTSRQDLPLLFITVFLVGCADTLFATAYQSVLPAIVADPSLRAANGRLQGSELVLGQMGGPPLGGLLFAVNRVLPFAADGISFLLSATLLASIRRPRRPSEARPANGSVARWSAAGLTYLWKDPILRGIAVFTGLTNLCTEATMAVLVIFTKNELHRGAATFGLLLAVAAVGGVIGSMAGPRCASRLGDRVTLLMVLAVQAVTQVAIFTFRSLLATAICLALAAFGIVIWNVVTVSLRQEITPDYLLGRVNSAHRFIAWGMLPLGAALGGIGAAMFGTRTLYLISGALLGASAVAALFVLPSPMNRAKPDSLPAVVESAA